MRCITGKSEGALQVKVVFFNISMFFTKKKKSITGTGTSEKRSFRVLEY